MAINTQVHLQAPAKINLFLHVLGQRVDGYHELQSVFRTINLFDQLTITVGGSQGEVELRCSSDLGPAEENLAYRAAEALREHACVDFGARISLDKFIPIGAGLGGGSSDAAAVLIGLNTLWGLDLPDRELSLLGARLGADIPFFIESGDAWVSGIGDELQPLNLPEAWYVLVYPGVVVPTGRIFSDPDLTRDSVPRTIARFLADPKQEKWLNDLERVAIGHYPEIGRAKNWLSREGAVKMSGSGSSVFAQVESEAEGQEIVSRLPSEWRGFVVQAGCVPSLQRQMTKQVARSGRDLNGGEANDSDILG